MQIFLTGWILSTIAFTAESFAQAVTPAFRVPRHSRGLAWAWDRLWVGGVGEKGAWIQGFDPETGELVDSLPAPVPDCLSLEGHKGGLVYVSNRSDSTYFLSRQGYRAVLNPFPHLAGLGSDGDNLWCATFFDPQGTLLQINDRGEILQALPYNGRQTRDMAYLRGRLYVADQLTQNIRVVDPVSGRLVRNIPAPGLNPSGVTSDGHNLWMLDEGDGKAKDQVYSILVRPDGGIRISTLYHNYGSVVINQNREWGVWIYNDGARETRLLSLEARDGNDDIFIPHVWNFPQTIGAGDSAQLRVTFSPAYQDSVHIYFALTYDLDRVENVIDLRGKGVRRQRDIQVPDRNLSFGLAYYGQGLQLSNLQHLLIENNGGEPLTVRNITFSDSSFFFGGFQFPHTFNEPGAYRIPIFFRPRRNGDIRAQATILSDDADSPNIHVSLLGTAQQRAYQGGTVLWNVTVGEQDLPAPRVRAILPVDDVSRDGLADVVIAANDYQLGCYHAAATLTTTPYWIYRTDANPWRMGRIAGEKAIGAGSDWNRDGITDMVLGIDGSALRIVALSGLDGQELWTVDTHGLRGYGGIPRIVNSNYDLTGDRIKDVIVATSPAGGDHVTQALFVIDGNTARIRWLVDLPNEPYSLEVLNDVTGDGTSDIVILLSNGSLFGFDGAEGNQIYESEVASDVRSLVKSGDVNGDRSQDILIVNYNNGVSMFNGSNGSLIWRARNLDEMVIATAVGDINRNGAPDVVVGDLASFFRAIDGRTGAAVWDTTFQVGARPTSIATLNDFDHDGRQDFAVGTLEGRLFAMSSRNPPSLMWSYSNVHEGHAFLMTLASRDIDGNGQMDVFTAMENGTVYAFAGSYIGLTAPEEGLELLPQSLTMAPAFPNPFNGVITLPVKLGEPGGLQFGIYDIAGREIYQKNLEFMTAGEHNLYWNGLNAFGTPVPSGVYFVKLSSGQMQALQQIQMVR